MAAGLPQPTNCCTANESSGECPDLTAELIASLNPFGYANITAMRDEFLNLTNLRPAILFGLNSAGDGLGGGVFYYDAASTADDDGISVIRPTIIPSDAPGRFIKVM
jgi:hypothetical protein